MPTLFAYVFPQVAASISSLAFFICLMSQSAFQTQHKSSKLSATVDFIDFDYHYQMKISKDSLSYLIKKLAPIVESNAFYLATEGNVKRYAACLNLPLLAF